MVARTNLRTDLMKPGQWCEMYLRDNTSGSRTGALGVDDLDSSPSDSALGLWNCEVLEGSGPGPAQTGADGENREHKTTHASDARNPQAQDEQNAGDNRPEPILANGREIIAAR